MAIDKETLPVPDPLAPSPAPSSSPAQEATLDGPRPLGQRIPEGGTRDADEILEIFLDWVSDKGFELYPAQEEAILEVMAGRHVILNTPTGSGKSLVAQALHFKGLCEGRRSFYTSPIKALASEKFFSLCDDFGAENVGMTTGDASLNPDAGVVCCTAEVLANMALRQGERVDAPYVVMDEFHYYSDRERGVAWQVPLITLPGTRFLLMSATLGDTSSIQESLGRQTRFEVAEVRSSERPVPLDYEYRETPLHETVEDLARRGKAPVYIVSFTQRECAELAQSLTSMQLTDKEEKKRIREAVGDFRFDTPYGKDIRRFLSFGIGIHHAGLLPKYRLLVEQLSQQGLLKVICGTDTLGVGVNIPLRTVLFTRLSKFDGRKMGLLSVRDFQQISGRAGRKGFDDQGSVVCQAPEHLIENKRLEDKASSDPKKRKKLVKKQAPKNFVHWDEKTFARLISSQPETLVSRFRLDHGMVLNLLQHDDEVDDPERRNFTAIRELLARCHEDEATQARLLSTAAKLVRSLYRAGIVNLVRDSRSEYLWVTVSQDLQQDFSLHQSLSLYLLETLSGLDPEAPEYPPTVLSLVEAILENPDLILRRQVDKAKGDLIGQLKAEGMDYEDRMERLQEVTYPKPEADFIYGTFDRFAEKHPWLRAGDIHPKSIAREVYETYASFDYYVRTYGLQRSEGLLLRYLSQFYKTLGQSVPASAQTDAVYDVLAFFRTLIERVDTSLLEEWESLLHPELRLRLSPQQQAAEHAQQRVLELVGDPKTFHARVRAEMHQLVRALATRDYEEAAFCTRDHSDDPWDAERFEEALAPYFEEYDEILFTPEARRIQHTQISTLERYLWKVTQILLDPEGDNMWFIEAEIDLTDPSYLDGPLPVVRHIGR